MKSHSLSKPIALDDIPEKHPVRQFYDYWVVLCGENSFALKADFDPSRIKSLLQYIAIVYLDRSCGELDLIIKLAGERFYQLGKVCAGQRLQDIFSEDEYNMRLVLYEELAKNPKGTFFHMKVPFKGREFIETIKGIFPFSSDGKIVDYHFLVID